MSRFTSLLTPSFIPATACLSLWYPTVLSVFIIILGSISCAVGHTARLILTFASWYSWYLCMLLTRLHYMYFMASSTKTKPCSGPHSLSPLCQEYCSKCWLVPLVSGNKFFDWLTYLWKCHLHRTRGFVYSICVNLILFSLHLMHKCIIMLPRPWFTLCVKQKSLDDFIPNSLQGLLYEASS